MNYISECNLNTVKNIVFPISPFKKKPKIRNTLCRQSERFSNCSLAEGNNHDVPVPSRSREITNAFKMVTRKNIKSNTGRKCLPYGKNDHDDIEMGLNNMSEISIIRPNLKSINGIRLSADSASTTKQQGLCDVMTAGKNKHENRILENVEPDPLNLTLMKTKRNLVDRIKQSMLNNNDDDDNKTVKSVDVDLSIVKVEMLDNETTGDVENEFVDHEQQEPGLSSQMEQINIKSEPICDLLQDDSQMNVIATYGHFMALPVSQQINFKFKADAIGNYADTVDGNEVNDKDDSVLMHKLICLICKRTENVWIKKSCIQGNIFICKTCGKLMDKGALNESTPRNVDCNILNVTCIKCNMTFSNALEVDLHNESVHRGKGEEEGTPKTRHLKPQFCSECNRTFSNVADVCKHIKQRRHKCEYCHKLFSTNSDLKKHVNIHTNERVYECVYCSKAFNSRGNMVKHLETHKERQRQFKCEFCSKTFLKSDHLKVHVNTHTNEKLYECQYCKKQFNRKYCLQLHINIHTLEKIYECQMCKKICMDPSTLRKHIATHSDQRPFKCEKCDKTFKQKPHLTTHMKIHCVKETFRCSYCDKMFFTRNALRVHINTHTREKSFYCVYCQKTFMTKCNLLTHINNKHMTDRTYKCSFCDKVFTDPSTVRKHENIHTNKLTYQCAYCKKVFLRKTHLRSHINMHIKNKPYKCNQCNKSFAIKSYLKIHNNIHDGIKPYKCKLCAKAFTSKSSLILHNNSHTKEKLFHCSYCEKDFTQKVNLKSHILRHHQNEQDPLVKPPSPNNVVNLVAG